MEATNATNWEPEVRGTKESENNSQGNPNSTGGVEGDSSRIGDVNQRTGGANRTQANKDSLGGGYTGGMLDQMIRDCEDRLEEAKACLDWYQNVKERELKRRENLRQLEELREKELLQAQKEAESQSE